MGGREAHRNRVLDVLPQQADVLVDGQEVGGVGGGEREHLPAMGGRRDIHVNTIHPHGLRRVCAAENKQSVRMLSRQTMQIQAEERERRKIERKSCAFFQAIVNSSYVGHAKAGDRSHREGKRATNPAALKPPPPHIYRANPTMLP